MPGENILQTFQKIATLSHRLDENIADLKQHKAETGATLTKQDDQLRVLRDQMADMRERLARLEAARNLDRAEAQTEVERFKLQMERAELRLRQLLPSTAKPDADIEPDSGI